MKKWFWIILSFFIAGIILLIWRIDNQDLGNSYYYLPKYEAIDIGYPEGAIIYKSAKKNLFTNIKIEADVIKVNSNEDFIIAIQKPIKINLDTTQSNSFGVNILRYFIIVKKADSIYGPYTKEEYVRMRDKLGITNTLQFEE